MSQVDGEVEEFSVKTPVLWSLDHGRGGCAAGERASRGCSQGYCVWYCVGEADGPWPVLVATALATGAGLMLVVRLLCLRALRGYASASS